MIDFEYKQSYKFDDLIKIVEILRGPDGCPWDREQTHKSIRDNFLEEVCEAIEGIDADDAEMLREELGDVLLQVILHARIAEEEGKFDIDGIADGIAKKLIHRHPHVFGDVIAGSTGEVLKNWDDIKRAAKGQETLAQAMRGISRGLPGFMRADKVLKRAGTDFENMKTVNVTDNLSDFTKEFEENYNKVLTNDELGDILFTVTAYARRNGLNPDAALNGACDRFIGRFEEFEKLNKGGK